MRSPRSAQLWALGCVLLLFALAPQEALSQCGRCQDSENAHRFIDPGAFFQCDGPGSVGCHSAWYTNWCNDHHNDCDLDDEDLEELAHAVETGNSELIEEVVAGVGGDLILDPAMGTLNLYCAEGLIARLRVTSAVAREVPEWGMRMFIL